MNNTWIQVLLNYANSKTVETKTKSHNRPMFWKKSQPNKSQDTTITVSMARRTI